ncbi:YdiK family protein [Neobacillus niacini]|uniref:YdiK family protein n=1 Tax=Neobacillus niacini TaxID=86668 RepID=UPI002041AA38|nr:YdiK family protein [Neobacillus niacini]MCM3694365.1 YdiK family protein [Neobacillus niacini]
MKRSPMFSGIIYIVLGCLFTYFAIEDVTLNGWGFFSYLLVILATFDFGSGIRMIFLHNRYKKQMKK